MRRPKTLPGRNGRERTLWLASLFLLRHKWWRNLSVAEPVVSEPPKGAPKTPSRRKSGDAGHGSASASASATGDRTRKSASKTGDARAVTPREKATPDAMLLGSATKDAGRDPPRKELFHRAGEAGAGGSGGERTNVTGTSVPRPKLSRDSHVYLMSKHLQGVAAQELCCVGEDPLVGPHPSPATDQPAIPGNVACFAVTQGLRGPLCTTIQRYSKGQHFSLQVQRFVHQGKTLVVAAMWLAVRPRAVRFVLQWMDFADLLELTGEVVSAKNERQMMERYIAVLLEQKGLEMEYLLTVNVRIFSGLWSVYEGGVRDGELVLHTLVPAVLDGSELLEWVPARFTCVLQVLEDLREECVNDRVTERHFAGLGLRLRFLPETNSWLYWGYAVRVLQLLSTTQADVCRFLSAGGDADRTELAGRLSSEEFRVGILCLLILLQPLVHAMSAVRDAHDLRCVVSAVVDFLNLLRGGIQGGAAELLPMACWPHVLDNAGNVFPLELPVGVLFARFRDLVLSIYGAGPGIILGEVQEALLELYGAWANMWSTVLTSDVSRGALFPLLTPDQVDASLDEVQQWGGSFGVVNEQLAAEVVKLTSQTGEARLLRDLWGAGKVRTKDNLGLLVAPGLICWRYVIGFLVALRRMVTGVLQLGWTRSLCDLAAVWTLDRRWLSCQCWSSCQCGRWRRLCTMKWRSCPVLLSIKLRPGQLM